MLAVIWGLSRSRMHKFLITSKGVEVRRFNLRSIIRYPESQCKQTVALDNLLQSLLMCQLGYLAQRNY